MAITMLVMDVLGVHRAKLQTDGVTLVAGPPGSGKSTVLEAAAAAFSKHFPIRQASTTDHRHRLKKLGSKYAPRIYLLAPEGRRLMHYHYWKVREAGKLPTFDPVTTGAVSFAGGEERWRWLLLTKRFPIKVTIEDVRSALGQFESDSPDYAERLLVECEQNAGYGWSLMEAAIPQRMEQIRERWNQITGVPLGRGAGLWRHPLVNYDAPLRIEPLWQAMERARLEMEERRERAQVTIDQVKEWQRQVGCLPWQRHLIAGFDGKIEARQKRLAAWVNKATDIQEQLQDPDLRRCPHCRKDIVILKSRGRIGLVETYRRPKLTREAARIKGLGLQALLGQIDRTTGQIDRWLGEKQQIEAIAAAGEMAAGLLENLGDIEDIGDYEAFLRACDVYLEKKALHDAHVDWAEARLMLREIRNLRQVRKAVGPEGARRLASERAFSEFNKALADLAGMARVAVPQVLGDGAITVGGVRLENCSETERWVAETIGRLALLLQDGGTFTTIQSLHLLPPAKRVPFLKMLRTMQLNAMVELRVYDDSEAPDMAKLKIGRTVWMEKGAIRDAG